MTKSDIRWMSLFNSVLILYNPYMGKRTNCACIVVLGSGDILFTAMVIAAMFLDSRFTSDFTLPLLLLTAAGIFILQKRLIVFPTAISVMHYHIGTLMVLFFESS